MVMKRVKVKRKRDGEDEWEDGFIYAAEKKKEVAQSDGKK
jgi:hypothetical protein